MAATGRRQWTPYEPDPTFPWTLRRVVHLHRRAGFAATWSELQRDLAEGPTASVSRILTQHKSHTPHKSYRTPEDFERVAEALADGAINSGNADRLKAWWVYRMLFTPDPLGERLTLMWHNHFATSNAKVNDLSATWQQNRSLRQDARLPFGETLNHVVRERALLIYLDAPGQP